MPRPNLSRRRRRDRAGCDGRRVHQGHRVRQGHRSDRGIRELRGRRRGRRRLARGGCTPRPHEGATEETEESGFVIRDDDEDDAPAQTVVTAGATADPVKDYLKQIGKVALLNAEQEVELAKRIEAGLFGEERLNGFSATRST